MELFSSIMLILILVLFMNRHTISEGFYGKTKCFSCERQMPQVGHPTKCFSCERQMPQVGHSTKCFSCERQTC